MQVPYEAFGCACNGFYWLKMPDKHISGQPGNQTKQIVSETMRFTDLTTPITCWHRCVGKNIKENDYTSGRYKRLL